MNADEIARFLRTHPQFFDQYPELLESIYVPHPHGGRTIALSERQILGLREKTKLLDAKLSELVRLGDPAQLLGGRNQQPVVGPDVNAPVCVAQRQRPPCATDPRIHDGEVDSLGHERQRVREGQGPLQDGLRRDAVSDVDDLHLRCNPLHHTVAGADEVVLQAEVRQERNEARHAAAESTRPATLCVSASATTVSPAPSAAAVVCGPIVIAGRSEPSFAQAAAFGLQAYQGGGPEAMVAHNLSMYDITHGEHPAFKIPYLGFRGTPTGIDVNKVVATGVVPVIDGGLAGKDGGQIGAGILKAPLACFIEAAAALRETG